MCAIRLLVGAFFILLPSIFIVVGGTMAWRQDHKLKTYKPAEAEVLSKTVETRRGNKNTTYKPVVSYRYSVNGKEYTCSDVAPLSSSRSGNWAHEIVARYTIGKTTTAYYDPDEPSRAFLLHEYSFFPYLFVLFPMIHLSLGVGMVFGSDWARTPKPPPAPLRASGGWFSVNPRRLLWQRMRGWMLMAMLWYGVGVLAIGHYFLSASPPYGAMAWIASGIYLALGLIPGWGWLHHFLLMRRTSDPILMTSVDRFTPGQTFDVRLIHPMHQQTLIESLKIGLVRTKQVKTRRGNKTQHETVTDYEDWRTVLENHEAEAGETIQQSACFTIPEDAIASSFGDYPRYEWKVEVHAALKDSPDYKAEFMIQVESGQLVTRPFQAVREAPEHQ